MGWLVFESSHRISFNLFMGYFDPRDFDGTRDTETLFFSGWSPLVGNGTEFSSETGKTDTSENFSSLGII